MKYDDLIQEWRGHCASTEPADRDAAQQGLRAIYAACGLREPKVLWFDSPLAALVAVSAIQREARVSDWAWRSSPNAAVQRGIVKTLNDQLDGRPTAADAGTRTAGNMARGALHHHIVFSHFPYSVRADLIVRSSQHGDFSQFEPWKPWDNTLMALYNAIGEQASDVDNEFGSDPIWRGNAQFHGGAVARVIAMWAELRPRSAQSALLDGWIQVAQSTGWWWALDGFVVCSDRPLVLRRDQRGLLHHDTGPAIAYRDGFAFHALHGVAVPQALIENKLTAREILNLPSPQQRVAGINRITWDRFIAEMRCRQVGAAVPDPGNPGQFLTLYQLPNNVFGRTARVLMCNNATPDPDGTRRRFGIPVPGHIDDPVGAAAWTFGIEPDEYRQLQYAY
jgi:hypothetical protein